MAEQVDHALDAMVPALQDLLTKGIFTQSEIRAIVNRRRQYEYLLRRREARKADFLTYIEDEMKLEKLRSFRNRKLIAQRRYEERQAEREAQKKEGKKGRHGDKKTKASHSSIGDASIVQHIHLIFTRAIRKWRGDVGLHLQHAAFAKKSKSWKKLGRIYAEALQVHPHNITLWVEAASFEYFGSGTDLDASASPPDGGQAASSAAIGSIANARVLLQRGLRCNPTAKDLWLQYFSLEFHYIQKLRGRREILQLGLNQKGLAETAANEDDVQSSAQIPIIIYKNAIQKVTDDVQFRLKFVEICRMYPETDEVEAMIMSTVERDFAHDPDAWIERAEYAADVGGDALSILEDATNSVQTEAMYLAAIDFAKEAITAETETLNVKVGASFLGRLFQKVKEAGISSAEILLEQSTYLVSIGDAPSSINLLRAAVYDDSIRGYGKDSRIWLELAQTIQIVSDAGCSTQQESRDVLEHAMKRIPIHDDRYVDIAILLFRTLLSQPPKSSAEKTQNKIAALFERILILSSNDSRQNSSMPELCFAYLQNSSMTGGLCAARKTYERIISKSSALQVYDEDIPAWKAFFDACINIERLSKGPNQTKNLRSLLDKSSAFFTKCNQKRIAKEYKRMVRY